MSLGRVDWEVRETVRIPGKAEKIGENEVRNRKKKYTRIDHEAKHHPGGILNELLVGGRLKMIKRCTS